MMIKVNEVEVIQKGKKSCSTKREIGNNTQVKLMSNFRELKGLIDSIMVYDIKAIKWGRALETWKDEAN